MRYEDIAGKGDAEIEALLFRQPDPAESRPLPDWAEVAAEMLKPAVTLLLVWREYRDHLQLAPEPRMRRTLMPAQMCEVDYAADAFSIGCSS